MKNIFSLFLLVLGLSLPLSVSYTSYGLVKEWEGPGMLVESLARQFNRPLSEVREIVKYAYTLGNPTKFPTPIDILAVVAVESRFDFKAKHPVGPSVGLMQINFGVHKTPNLYDVKTNMVKGTQILYEYHKLARSDIRALVYYNAGPGGGRVICEESCNTPYVEKMLSHKRKFTSYANKERMQCSS